MITVKQVGPNDFIARGYGCSGGGRTESEAREQLHNAMINDKIMNPEKYQLKETLIYDRTNNRYSKITAY